MASSTSFCCIKLLLWLTLNAAFFIIGIVLYLGGTSQYGQVISYEADEWSKGPIIDIITYSNSSCPSGYDLVTGEFFGTKTICNKGLWYDIGKCGKKEAGWTQYGLDHSTLNKFNNAYICVLRDTKQTYHSLLSYRQNSSTANNCTGDTPKVCGSKTNTEKGFCVPSDQSCAVNSFLVQVQGQDNSSTILSNATVILNKTFGTNFTSYQVFDNSSNNPISDIYISMSRPCGNRKQDYMMRPNKIKKIYGDDDHSCKYNHNGQEHELYVTAGFDQREYDVYNAHNLIKSIKEKVPDYKDSDLESNSYKVYYKPYSFWSSACTNKNLTTLKLKVEADNIGDVTEYFFGLFVITVLLYFIQLALIIITATISRCRPCIVYTVQIIFGLMESAGYGALVIIYCITIEGYIQIDIEILKSFRDSKCSDGVLQYSIDQFANKYEHDLAVLGVGFGFVIAACLLKVIVCGFCSPLRTMVKIESKTAIEIKIDSWFENIKSRRVNKTQVALPEDSESQHLPIAPTGADLHGTSVNLGTAQGNEMRRSITTFEKSQTSITDQTTRQTLIQQRTLNRESKSISQQQQQSPQKVLPPVKNPKQVAGPKQTRGVVFNEHEMNEMERD